MSRQPRLKRLPQSRGETLAQLIDRAALGFPDSVLDLADPSPYIGASVRRLRYANLRLVVAEAARRLHQGGVVGGSRVALVKRNHPDTLLLAAAIMRLGAVPALISAKVPPEHLRVMLGRLDPALVLADEEGAAVLRTGGDGIPTVSMLDQVLGRDLLTTAQQPDSVAPVPASPHAPVVITHTSGTTGVPKLVVHTSTSLAGRIRPQLARVPIFALKANDRYACAIPWTHARAIDLFMSILHLGTRMLAFSSDDSDVVKRELAHFRPTVFEAVPNLFLAWEDLARTAPHLFARTRIFGNTFDAVHPRTVRTFLEAADRKPVLWCQAYGQSETGGITLAAYRRRDVCRVEGGSLSLRDVGWAFPRYAAVRVTDPETGRVLPAGSVGQLEVRSPGVAATYLGQEELHARRFRDGWWTMGDIGVRSRSGRVRLLDRHVDLIPGLPSGLAVEDELLDRLPLAREVVVLPGGEDGPLAVVSTDGDVPLEQAAWAEAVADLAAGHGCRPVQLPSGLWPYTSTLKVRRAELVRIIAAADLAHRTGAVPLVSLPRPDEAVALVRQPSGTTS